jgi:hypothetical protein
MHGAFIPFYFILVALKTHGEKMRERSCKCLTHGTRTQTQWNNEIEVENEIDD